MIQPQDESPPTQLLAYDAVAPGAQGNAMRVLLGYWTGVGIAALLYTAFAMWWTFRETTEPITRIVEGVAAPLGMAMMSLVPGTLFLGLALLIKAKIISNAYAQFAGFRSAVFCGFLIGLYPWPLQIRLQSYDWFVWFWIVGLAWHVVLPCTAGFLLCYRMHVRK